MSNGDLEVGRSQKCGQETGTYLRAGVIGLMVYLLEVQVHGRVSMPNAFPSPFPKISFATEAC